LLCHFLYWALLGNSFSNPKFHVFRFVSGENGFPGDLHQH